MSFKTMGMMVVIAAVVGALAYNFGANKGDTVPAVVTGQQPYANSAQPTPVAQAPAQGQPRELMPNLPAGNHPTYERFTHFRVGNRNVKSILADGDLVWIGTSGGVVRYDTRNDQHQMFNVESGSLISNGVFHVSKLGNEIVVGTYGGGMSIHNPADGSWRNYNIPQGLADQFVYDVLKADNGDVWIATWSGANLVRGGDFDNPAAWVTYTVKNTDGGLPNDWVYGLEKGPNGDIWLGTEGGLALYRNGTWANWAHEEGLGAKYEQVKEDIRFTNDPGTASKHHARQKVEQGLEDVNIAYNPNYIISMAIDPQGNVWCGTWGGGLSVFDGSNWKTYTVADGLPANHIFMLHVDKQGVLWAGTSKGLARFNGEDKGFTIKTTQDGLFSENVFSMAEANNGNVWVGSFGGVAQIRDFN